MSFTESQLTALEKAYAEGVLEIKYGDKTIKYRTLNEMRQAINDIKKSLGGSYKKKTRLTAVFSKGL